MTAHKMTLSNKELREFGLLFGAIFVTLFGFLVPWIFNGSFPVWPWYVLAVTGGLGVLYPPSLKPFYHLWMKFGFVMGWLNTRIILGIVFYLVFMPFGLVIRLLGKDLLMKKLDAKTKSYRVIPNEEQKSSLENPY